MMLVLFEMKQEVWTLKEAGDRLIELSCIAIAYKKKSNTQNKTELQVLCQ